MHSIVHRCPAMLVWYSLAGGKPMALLWWAYGNNPVIYCMYIYICICMYVCMYVCILIIFTVPYYAFMCVFMFFIQDIYSIFVLHIFVNVWHQFFLFLCSYFATAKNGGGSNTTSTESMWLIIVSQWVFLLLYLRVLQVAYLTREVN